jgi:hypothetical protein
VNTRFASKRIRSVFPEVRELADALAPMTIISLAGNTRAPLGCSGDVQVAPNIGMGWHVLSTNAVHGCTVIPTRVA